MAEANYYGSTRGTQDDTAAHTELSFLQNVKGHVGFTVFLGIMLAIPISMIVIGAKYFDDCPAEHYIPIYLVVAGSFSALRNFITIVCRCCQEQKVNPVGAIIDCFMSAWFIAGNVWIYRTKGEFSTNPSDPKFCDPTLYWFAFWITTAAYIIIGCRLCCFCI